MCQIYFLFLFLYAFFTPKECVNRNLIKKWTHVCSFLVIHFLKWLMETTMIETMINIYMPKH